jgi:hypothetical protein
MMNTVNTQSATGYAASDFGHQFEGNSDAAAKALMQCLRPRVNVGHLVINANSIFFNNCYLYGKRSINRAIPLASKLV